MCLYLLPSRRAVAAAAGAQQGRGAFDQDTVPRLPLYVALGHRREWFDLKRGEALPRQQELGGLLLTVGVQAGLVTR